MAQPTNDGNIVKRTSQYLDNLEHDEVTGGKGVTLYGTDGTNVWRLAVNSDGALATSGVKYKTKIDTSNADIVYIGKAPIGSSTSSAVWAISKVDTSSTSDGTVTYAAAGASTATWDNRAGETYS